MRSEHRTTSDEWDACTGWRRVMHWRAGQRKAIKVRSHRRDRRAWRMDVVHGPDGVLVTGCRIAGSK